MEKKGDRRRTCMRGSCLPPVCSPPSLYIPARTAHACLGQGVRASSKAASTPDRSLSPPRVGEGNERSRGRGTTRQRGGGLDADRWGGGCARKARMDCGQSLGRAEILGSLDLPLPFPDWPPARPRAPPFPHCNRHHLHPPPTATAPARVVG
jgi:hypothetical protein